MKHKVFPDIEVRATSGGSVVLTQGLSRIIIEEESAPVLAKHIARVVERMTRMTDDVHTQNYRMIAEHLRPVVVDVAEALKVVGASPQSVGVVLHDVLHAELLPYVMREVFNGA